MFTVQTDSDLDASIFTEHSYGREYALPVVVEAETASTGAVRIINNSCNSNATSANIPSLPSHSTVGPSSPSTGPHSDPSSGPPSTSIPSTESASESVILWHDMGPHQNGDETHPLFLDLYSMKYLRQLDTTQWFLNHLMIEHRSLAHRLLIVSK